MTAFVDLRTMGLVYLATPYSKYPNGIHAAHDDACKLMARLLKAGVKKLFCPIAHTHNVAEIGGINPLDHEIWLPLDESLMCVCDTLCVAQMNGWQRSYGIAKEIEFFAGFGRPVVFLDPETLRVSTNPCVSALKEEPVAS